MVRLRSSKMVVDNIGELLVAQVTHTPRTPAPICHIHNIVIDTQHVLQLQTHYHITPQTSTPHSSHYHTSLLIPAHLTPH